MTVSTVKLNEKVSVVNPSTGKVIHEYALHTDGEIRHALERSNEAFDVWRQVSLARRAKPLELVAILLEKRKKRYAQLMAEEMGKPLKEGIAEVEKCAFTCRYYAEEGPSFLDDEMADIGGDKAYVTYQPLGIILAVMPWNFPFWQVFRFAAPNLLAGNTAVLKHASNVPRCALAIEELLTDAGFPEAVFTTVLAASNQVQTMIENPLVKAVTLTGSTPAGRDVAAVAGKALKKTVLELGGSDPYVILSDAELDRAVEICVKARLINGGQSCIAAKRFVVVDEVHDAFVEKILARMQSITMGDPLDEDTDIGPMARHELRDHLHAQVEKSVRAGAHCLIGGGVPNDGPHRKGAYYPPTILTHVRPGMPAYDDELFGPVAAVIHANDEADAIRIANESPYGLGAAVFTADLSRGERIAREELTAGTCVVNGQVASDPRLPFGGVKESGYGRELARDGLREFVNIKTIKVCQ